ncbi:50S ribosomal protein 5 alpha, chloroplastic isoform X1 [Hibiscus syriacus]|uniref:50S ribosomal protein 5 alpha, chloroplastic isoform X1 n=1 Tax=Hibiscus syriacus TaxID=106335 RepID=UPI0019225BF9|nr:50S ribosomal protein 5 alpha, chloroplastic isoform X1 [Hibiscus syriacus]
MALLACNPLPSLSSSPFPSCSTSLPIFVLPSMSAFSFHSVFSGNFHRTPLVIDLVPNKKRSGMIVKASAESTDGEQQVPSETKKEDLAVGQLPLETKMQQLAEQKMRMKLAKKIRLRRKRLVRKRKLRKKGRWPPSKMKKLKNV